MTETSSSDRRVRLSLLALLAVVLAACGGGDGPASDSGDVVVAEEGANGETDPAEGDDDSSEGGGGDDSKYDDLHWLRLADYEYIYPEEDELTEDQLADRKKLIPKEVWDLDGSWVELKGYLLPVTFDNESGRVLEAVLAATNHAVCGFGADIEMNEWILVKMPKEVPRFNTFLPLTVRGELEVGEDYQDGWVMSIYRMDAHELEV
ncbi:MAG: DUF3299 domain-containing protein [Acidobacteriota bacterium]